MQNLPIQNIARVNKRGYEFSFAWLFAIIVGAAVIFLAIYVATQIALMKQTEREAVRGKDIGILTTPVETGLEEGKFATIIVPEDTIVFTECQTQTSSDPFGTQQIGTAIKPKVGEWASDPDSILKSSFHNKYLFTSNETILGEKEFYVLSKPLNLPFKIADLIMIWGDNETYCFDTAGAPDVRTELARLNLTNVIIKGTTSCPPKSTRVCFSGTNCDIKVTQAGDWGTVQKNGAVVYYISSCAKSGCSDKFGLMFAAIFSSPQTYECQIKRLMAHSAYLADLYKSKVQHLGCANTLLAPLLNYRNSVSSISTRESLGSSEFLTPTGADIYRNAQEVWDANRWLSCKIF